MARERTAKTPLPTGINTGPGRTLTAVYALFAVAATGRSTVQLIADAGKAPLAYSLSALAAVIYLLATACLAIGDRARYVAIGACSVELAGVLVVGTLSYLARDLFPDRTVWSHFGQGYGYIPLVLPLVGLWWLLRGRRGRDDE
ncbi:hypothetical protein AB0E69_40465 [Kribbella sp. NPDC026611]|uniref:hypothetical protein n=1 Tax=Kribbella sp. NPDC026611 TaxID=3154911 RepID=UPI0033D6AB65